MRFTRRTMQPKAIKRLSWRCGWIHVGLCAVFAVWGGLVWNDVLKWTPIPFMVLFHASVYGNIIYWPVLRRRIYRQAMAAHYMLCDDCLYDLREVTTPICPECGKEFTRSSLRRAWLWESHQRRRFR